MRALIAVIERCPDTGLDAGFVPGDAALAHVRRIVASARTAI